jgi:hypothetical protein
VINPRIWMRDIELTGADCGNRPEKWIIPIIFRIILVHVNKEIFINRKKYIELAYLKGGKHPLSMGPFK